MLLLALAMAATPPPIVGGEETDQYPAVVMLYTGGGTCSGTVIAPRWVLTAAHCVEGIDAPGQVTAYVGARPDNGKLDDMARVDRVAWHPDYRSNMTTGADVGLVHLASPLDVEPMRLVDEAITPSWVGRDVRYVGFGVTSENAGDSGTKRTVVVPFYQLDEHWMFTLDPGHNMCWGDSGGPAFVEEEGELAVAGIISWVGSNDDADRPCSTGWGSSTRIDTVRDWIQEHTDVRHVADTSDPASWDTAPELEPVDTGREEPADPRGCSSHPTSGGLALLLLAVLRRR